MFTAAESDPRLSKEQAGPLEAKLRTALLKAQYARLQKAQRSLLIVIAGIDGAGKGAAVNLINEWMDARHIRTMAFGAPTPEELRYPPLWRYWQQLPAKGRTGIVFGSWYQPLLKEAAKRKPDQGKIQNLAQAIQEFESMLAQDGVQIVKLWYHLSRNAQKERTDKLLGSPDTAWQVRPGELKVRKKFNRLRGAGELAITLTQADHAPWQIIPSADPDVRAVATGQAVLAALRQRPASRSEPSPQKKMTSAAEAAAVNKKTPRRLENLDYTARLDGKEYDEQLAAWQSRLAGLVRHDKFKTRSLILAFEGQDAAGKGGAIRRVTHALDARQYHIHPISAPSDAELAHPYLWRFWRSLPLPGRVSVFDRSWYGRVLVERVEKLIAPQDWQRAYSEINQFEAQLSNNGAIIVKFWLAVTADEQLRRFHEREESPFKNFKITPDDWRNRKKWHSYVQAADEMLARTDTPQAPWHVLSANDKQHARVAVLRHIVETLEKALGKDKN
jgi:polyphosphate:AMP phosphotransferase